MCPVLILEDLWTSLPRYCGGGDAALRLPDRKLFLLLEFVPHVSISHHRPHIVMSSIWLIDGMDQVELFEAICHENYYQFSDELGPSNEAAEVVDLLLEKDPAQRLGMLAGGVEDVTTHDWFSKYDLDITKMRNKMIRAPWRPISDDYDEDDDFAADIDDDIDLHHIIEEEDEHEEESPEVSEKPKPNTILDIQAPTLDPSTRDEDDDDDDVAAAVPIPSVGTISPKGNTGSGYDSSGSPSKKKVTLKYNVISPRREQSKQEKEQESKERRATVSGALLANLSDDNNSSEDDELVQARTKIETTADSPTVASTNKKQDVQPQVKKNKKKKPGSNTSEQKQQQLPPPPPGGAPKSPISPSAPAAVSLLSPKSRQKFKANANKGGHHSPKMSKEEREKVSKARRETVSGSVLASLAGLGINDSDDE